MIVDIHYNEVERVYEIESDSMEDVEEFEEEYDEWLCMLGMILYYNGLGYE